MYVLLEQVYVAMPLGHVRASCNKVIVKVYPGVVYLSIGPKRRAV